QARFTSSQRQTCPERQPPAQPDSHMTGSVVVVVELAAGSTLTTRVTNVSTSASIVLASSVVRQPFPRSAFEKALSSLRCCFSRHTALTPPAFLAASAKHSRLPRAFLPAAIRLAAAHFP